ncbi:MAG: disulfide bond formation protein B [Dehalococcoidia bacterium]
MESTTVSSILAPGSILVLVASVAAAAVAGTPGAHQLRAFVLARGPWLAFAVAAIAMTGSLYYSEVAHFTPCEWCWFQRIAMYPLAVVLLIAAITRDTRAWRYAVPLAAIGLLFSMYHYQLELFPDQPTICSTTVPCSVRWVSVYGFVSIAFMAGAGFASILALQFAMARARRMQPGA